MQHATALMASGEEKSGVRSKETAVALPPDEEEEK